MSSNPEFFDQTPKASPEARGKRVESLRRMTRNSRQQFALKYGIAKTSMQNWEDAVGNGLTDKGARRLIATLKSAGIICTYDWLMFGIGQSPLITDHLFLDNKNEEIEPKSAPDESSDEESKISQELMLFHQHYPKTGVDYVVSDDGMEPRFIKGEYVAGCKYFGKMISEAVGYDSIIQTIEGDILLRHIKKIEDKDEYNLVCINPKTTVERPILYQVKLLWAAPVIWARRTKKTD